jgi:hypothetical protein
MRPTLAFIRDQVLQFWPPYRQEIHDAADQREDLSAVSESTAKNQQTVASAVETGDAPQRLAR